MLARPLAAGSRRIRPACPASANLHLWHVAVRQADVSRTTSLGKIESHLFASLSCTGLSDVGEWCMTGTRVVDELVYRRDEKEFSHGRLHQQAPQR
jgi:hypothetical protein